jgi:glycerol-3-phosphate dehydrogenase
MAEKAINLAVNKAAMPAASSSTATTPIFGGDIDEITRFRDQACSDNVDKYDPAVVSQMVQNYGTQYRTILDIAADNPKYQQLIPDTKSLLAEVIYNIQHEMAFSLADIVFRRTDIATGGNPGDAALKACSELLAERLDWPAEKVAAEMASVRARFPSF